MAILKSSQNLNELNGLPQLILISTVMHLPYKTYFLISITAYPTKKIEPKKSFYLITIRLLLYYCKVNLKGTLFSFLN